LTETVYCSECIIEPVQGPYIRCEACRARGREKAARHRAANPPARPQGRPRGSVTGSRRTSPRKAVTAAAPMPPPTPRSNAPTLTDGTLKRFHSLPAAAQEAVTNVVKAHIRACLNLGFAPENLDRVYAEAMELVQMEAAQLKPKAQEDKAIREPYRRYGQYQSPRYDLL